MGLMDRDYYREKPKVSKKEELLSKLRENPLLVLGVIIAIALAVVFLL